MAEAIYRRGGFFDFVGDFFHPEATKQETERYDGLFKRWRSHERYQTKENYPPVRHDYSDTDAPAGFFDPGFDRQMEESIADSNRPRKPRSDYLPREPERTTKRKDRREKDGVTQIAAAAARGAAEGILGYEGEGAKHYIGKSLAALGGFVVGGLLFLGFSSQLSQSVQSGQVSGTTPISAYLVWTLPFVGAYLGSKLYGWYYKF